MATLMTRDAGNEGARLAPLVTSAVYELSTILHLFVLVTLVWVKMAVD